MVAPSMGREAAYWAKYAACGSQAREGKVVQVYRKKWIIHIERVSKDKKNGEAPYRGPEEAHTCHERTCHCVC